MASVSTYRGMDQLRHRQFAGHTELRINSEEFKKDAVSRLTDRVRDEIQKDLNRTKTSPRIETKEGQEELRRVLLAVAYCLPEIGYCQGMNFIASCLIALADSEE